MTDLYSIFKVVKVHVALIVSSLIFSLLLMVNTRRYFALKKKKKNLKFVLEVCFRELNPQILLKYTREANIFLPVLCLRNDYRWKVNTLSFL